MRNKTHSKQRDILYILISSLVVVIFWIVSNIVHIWATTTVSEELQLQLTPINGTFDTDTLNKLKSRAHVTPQYERQTKSGDSQAILPTPTEALSPLDTVVTNPVASSSSQSEPENTDSSFLIEGQ